MRALSRLLLALAVAVSLFGGPAWAGRGGGHSYSSKPSHSGTTHVRGYVRKDGTYVRPHTRRSPGTGTTHSTWGRSYRPRTYHSVSRTRWRYGSGVTNWHARRQSTTEFYGLTRDSHGRIRRSEAAKLAFRRRHPCPSTGKVYGPCPGYVIDHIRALKHGGADSPSNMQWQTKAEAKAKDKWE
jgi:hypothetical protein